MADTVKSRKRGLKSVYVDNDSDDDFSDPTPAQPKSSKLKRKKAAAPTKDKVTVYTSTQGLEKSLNSSPLGRKSRVSVEEIRFQREIEEALKISSYDDTNSSVEIMTVDKKEENSSTFDTLPYASSDGENKENEVSDGNAEVSTDNAGFAAGLSEKEMGPGLNKLKEDVPLVEDNGLEQKKTRQSPVKKFEPKTKKKDTWIVAGGKEQVSKKAVDISTDDETVRKDICVIAQVHKSDAGSDCEKARRTTKTLHPITEDSEEEDLKNKASSSKKKRAKKMDSDDDYDMNPVVNTKRKRRSRKLESDDEFEDQDFGAEDIVEVDGSEADDSEDEYKPAKKKQQKSKTAAKKASPKTKTPPAAAKKTTTAGKKDNAKLEAAGDKEEFTSVKHKSGNESKSQSAAASKPSPLTTPKLPRTAAIKTPLTASKLPASPAPEISSKMLAAGFTKASKVSSPVTTSAPATPILSKPKPGPVGSFSKVKIPSWTPPAKIGTGSNNVSSKTPSSLGISPGTGPRLGLSRKMRVLKPLHACVKNTQ